MARRTTRQQTETTRQFIERAMRENHGYTVPERWLADLDAIPDGDTGEPQSGYLVGTDTPTTQERALLRKLAEEFGDGPTTANPRKMRLSSSATTNEEILAQPNHTLAAEWPTYANVFRLETRASDISVTHHRTRDRTGKGSGRPVDWER